MDTIEQRLGRRLREVRRSRGLSQAQLAERVGGGCAPETIGRYERGAMAPSLGTVPRLAAALNLDVNEFLGPMFSERRAAVQNVVDALSPLPDEKLARVEQIIRMMIELGVPEAERPAAPSALAKGRVSKRKPKVKGAA